MNPIISEISYCSTNTYLVQGSRGNLLVDTGYAGTLRPFHEAMKECGLSASDISYVMATHYHPDHIGLLPALASYGIPIATFGCQPAHLHDSDTIYAREPNSPFSPLDDSTIRAIPLEESRSFLCEELGIDGEVVALPSHTPDSVGLLLDSGEAFVGDLTHLSCCDFAGEEPVARDWQAVLSVCPHTIYYGHAPAAHLGNDEDSLRYFISD